MKLATEEAKEARCRRLAYKHSMAIEGIHLTAEETAVLDEIDRQRMSYEDGARFVEDWLRRKGVIPAAPCGSE